MYIESFCKDKVRFTRWRTTVDGGVYFCVYISQCVYYRWYHYFRAMSSSSIYHSDRRASFHFVDAVDAVDMSMWTSTASLSSWIKWFEHLNSLYILYSVRCRTLSCARAYVSVNFHSYGTEYMVHATQFGRYAYDGIYSIYVLMVECSSKFSPVRVCMQYAQYTINSNSIFPKSVLVPKRKTVSRSTCRQSVHFFHREHISRGLSIFAKLIFVFIPTFFVVDLVYIHLRVFLAESNSRK